MAFAVALAILIYVRTDAPLREIDARARTVAVSKRWLLAHALLLIPLAISLHGLYRSQVTEPAFALLAAAMLLLALIAVAALAAGWGPWWLWRGGVVAVGDRWAYAALGAAAATAAIVASQDLWAPMAQVTFTMVRWVLAPLLPGLQTDAAARVLRAPNFAVEVSRPCSGLEGVGLILAFLSVWLLYFRKEYRFPRALWLLPGGVILVLILNVVRIAALVLIGNAGHPGIAVYGFHSQAGWIAFNAIACALAWVSQRSHWLSRAATRADRAHTVNPTAAYLVPLLSVLAAGMISHAISGRFDTWYALRLLAGGYALAHYWPALRGLDWRFSGWGIGTGVIAFALTLAVSRMVVAHHGMPAALQVMAAPARTLWIASRAATTLVLVPLAAELAYHGYLMRRLVAGHFEAVDFGSIGWLPLLVAAVAYSVIHPALWLAALATGILYGLVLIRTQRIGEAVAAHVTANALLSAAVLLGHQWQLW